MVTDGYKDTEIGVIPIEWDVVELNNIAKLNKKKYIPIQSESINYIGLEHINQKQGTINGIGSSNDTLSQKNYFSKGEILFGKLRPYLCKFYLAEIDGVCSTEILVIQAKNNILNSILFQIVKTEAFIEHSVSKVFGTKMPRTSWDIIKEFKFPLPPLKEQEKIADILSTADDKIDAIATQIEKAETLKKGLLQKLLSEGIGHSEFKDSELGKIPKSWEVVELSTITTILLSNVDKKSKEDEQDVKLCNYMDVYNNQYITNDLVYMEATAKDNQIEKFQLQINDVIITKDSETKDDIAIPAVVRETFENLICGYHLAVLRPKENILYGVYLMKAIQSVNVHKHFEKLANGITRFGLTSSAINQALIPLPPLEEQKQIADILSTVDKKLEVLRAKKEKYEILKKGLLQKLLSGEVRV